MYAIFALVEVRRTDPAVAGQNKRQLTLRLLRHSRHSVVVEVGEAMPTGKTRSSTGCRGTSLSLPDLFHHGEIGRGGDSRLFQMDEK